MGGAAQGFPQSGVKASPALRHRLPLGQVGKLAVRLGTIFRLSVPVRIARLARTDCRGTCRSRGRCSPPMSQQGGISNISTHLIPWLQKQIWNEIAELDTCCEFRLKFLQFQIFAVTSTVMIFAKTPPKTLYMTRSQMLWKTMCNMPAKFLRLIQCTKFCSKIVHLSPYTHSFQNMYDMISTKFDHLAKKIDKQSWKWPFGGNVNRPCFALGGAWGQIVDTRSNFWVQPNTANYAKYGIWGAFWGISNMVKWGVP